MPKIKFTLRDDGMPLLNDQPLVGKTVGGGYWNFNDVVTDLCEYKAEIELPAESTLVRDFCPDPQST